MAVHAWVITDRYVKVRLNVPQEDTVKDISYEVEIVEVIEDESLILEVEDCDPTIDIDCTLDMAEAKLPNSTPTSSTCHLLIPNLPPRSEAGDDFVSFINEESGTIRDGKGQLTAKVGIIESLDALVKELVADEKKAVYSKIEQEVEKHKGSTASSHSIEAEDIAVDTLEKYDTELFCYYLNLFLVP
ncbi:hypothetical protein Ddye_000702 [Dipteronia dyeriana]|uniref:Uncharacterized protein n=1 Tax=Dipteronia dyeriana TaxID=168575 RepID=A0AAE0CTB9_9ROSI|nr:hypothetical protein Ddye_000702 [Dipteronia dyeriana]